MEKYTSTIPFWEMNFKASTSGEVIVDFYQFQKYYVVNLRCDFTLILKARRCFENELPDGIKEKSLKNFMKTRIHLNEKFLS